jgi:hypothetical protein
LRHPKRYQDVEELLAAGIDVYTTLNIQHLESLNDVITQITGVTVRETIPDSVLDQVTEIELTDLPPDELLIRLQEGKVYVPEQAAQAIHNFFRKGNLTALRELTMRLAARWTTRCGLHVDKAIPIRRQQSDCWLISPHPRGEWSCDRLPPGRRTNSEWSVWQKHWTFCLSPEENACPDPALAEELGTLADTARFVPEALLKYA